jgi:CPA2 family monovalent cation:H+ antiporter-2
MEGSGPVILEIGIVLSIAVAAGWLMRRLGLPAVIGYLAVGLVVSPFTPGYVADRHELHVLADIGVVLLLFEVGIEIDPLQLSRGRKAFLWVVPLHTAIVTGLAALAAIGFGLDWRGGLLIGVSVALSSSVVIVNITRSARRTTTEATDRALLGWSVLQDVTGVTLAAVIVAIIGVQGRAPWLAILGMIGFGLVAMLAALLLPRLLGKLRDQPDLFLALSVAAGLTLAAIGDQLFGLPLALAAFIAGLAISEGPDTAAARQRLLPFRDLFAILFFVAIGTLIDPAAIPAALGWIAMLLSLVVIVKAGSAYGVVRLLRMPGVSGWQVSTGLAQIGEFSFVLAGIASTERLIPPATYTGVLAAVVLTIAASTILVRWPRAAPARMPTQTRDLGGVAP